MSKQDEAERRYQELEQDFTDMIHGKISLSRGYEGLVNKMDHFISAIVHGLVSEDYLPKIESFHRRLTNFYKVKFQLEHQK